MESAIQRVMSLSQLIPSPEVDAAFMALRREVAQAAEYPDITPEMAAELRRRCAMIERETEQQWAYDIARSERPQEMIENAPHYEVYGELVRRELSLVARTGLVLDRHAEVAIIGSGPLPLTAWWVRRLTGAWLTHIDISEDAIRASECVACALDWKCEHILSDGQEVSLDPERYDMIYVAGLAGRDGQEKQRIIDSVLCGLKPEGRIVMRSARGVRGLLYPAFSVDDIHGIQLKEAYHPTDDIINSVYVYGKDGNGED